MSRLDIENKNRHSLSSDHVVFVTAKRDHFKWIGEERLRNAKKKNYIQRVQSYSFSLSNRQICRCSVETEIAFHLNMT